MQHPIRRSLKILSLPNTNDPKEWAKNPCRTDDTGDLQGFAASIEMHPKPETINPILVRTTSKAPSGPSAPTEPLFTLKATPYYFHSIADGFRRVGAFHLLLQKYPQGNLVPQTDPETGETTKVLVKYDEIEAAVYQDISDAEFMELAVQEVGNRRGLTRQGLMFAIANFINSHPAYTWQQLEAAFRQPLNEIFGVLKPEQTRRPTIQDIERALRLPGDLKDPVTPKGAWFAKQATNNGSGFPTNQFIRELNGKMDAAAKNLPRDPLTNKVSEALLKDTFAKAVAPLWEAALQAHTKNPTGASGQTPRNLSGKTLTTLYEVAKNPKTLVFLQMVTGQHGQDPTELFVKLDAIMDLPEAQFRDEMNRILGL